jgi:hypothetical protein
MVLKKIIYRYVSNIYTSSTGTKFDRSQKDSNGRLAHGAYGK